MKSLFRKIVAFLIIGLVLLGIAGGSKVHKMTRGIDPGPANIVRL